MYLTIRSLPGTTIDRVVVGFVVVYDDDEIRLFNDASIDLSKMICVKTPDMYTVYIIAKDMIMVNIWSCVSR